MANPANVFRAIYESLEYTMIHGGASKVGGQILKAAKPIGKGAVEVAKFGGAAYYGAHKAAAEVGTAVVHDGYKLGKAVFRQTLVDGNIEDASMKDIAKGYLHNLSEGQIVPVKLKKGLGAAAFLGLAGAGVVNGAGDGMNQHHYTDPDVAQAEIPNVIDRMMSPPPRPVDNMGAHGDLVMALNKLR